MVRILNQKSLTMDSKLKTRVITAILFGVVMLACICINKWSAMAMVATVSLGANYEYGKMVDSISLVKRWALFGFGVIGLLMPFFFISPYIVDYLLVVAVFSCLFLIVNLYINPPLIQHRLSSVRWMSMVYTGLLPGLMLHTLYHVEPYRPSLLLSIFGGLWVTDTAAYLVGSQIGKRKLFPSVSPNKTWEGSLAAGAFAVIYGLVLWQLGVLEMNVLEATIFGLVLWVFGTYGDLVESSIKRYCNIKDSGNFLPGHGGFLDRFDSFIFVVPFVLLFIKMMLH